MVRMLWPSVHRAVPRTCYSWPELPWEPAAPLVREFTQVDGDALRWLRTEQMPRMPARPLEASLPPSLKMPKLGFWRETEAQRPTCPQGENVFVHSVLMRAAWQCTGDRAWENAGSSSLSQELSRSVALASASKSEGLYRVCLIFSHSPTYGFWENALLKGCVGGWHLFLWAWVLLWHSL